MLRADTRSPTESTVRLIAAVPADLDPCSSSRLSKAVGRLIATASAASLRRQDPCGGRTAGGAVRPAAPEPGDQSSSIDTRRPAVVQLIPAHRVVAHAHSQGPRRSVKIFNPQEVGQPCEHASRLSANARDVRHRVPDTLRRARRQRVDRRPAHTFRPFRDPAARATTARRRPPRQPGRARVRRLLALGARPGQLLTKVELLDVVWPNHFVEENNCRCRSVRCAGFSGRA